MRFLFGVLVGGILGWVVGVLLAPQSGQETRSMIGEKAIELRRKAGQAAGQVKDEGQGS
ncbi:MAG TPA: YtxH domain-containing protein [Anaerolineae bacterium]|nr:YtxH domain-containing protein [Anaerolineae bacterium]